MLKNKFLLGSVLAAFVFGTQVSTVNALELDEDTRTVVLDSKGNTVVLTPEQVKAILELRLQRLTGLEREKVEKDLVEESKKITEYLSILSWLFCTHLSTLVWT